MWWVRSVGLNLLHSKEAEALPSSHLRKEGLELVQVLEKAGGVNVQTGQALGSFLSRQPGWMWLLQTCDESAPGSGHCDHCPPG